ncbi:hypothetical protein EJ03DRAFT_331843 [Teratosphaeria nubilosa]|uniref:Secreted protein n=1 Tax=Teratosphaeria nubilosa TaxID=161662 RepID=A0A6G1KVV4_9PEZI|nr:hypothetical protein EJ03DRAFT_331843 [Teratosphaeria nubilosa]
MALMQWESWTAPVLLLSFQRLLSISSPLVTTSQRHGPHGLPQEARSQPHPILRHPAKAPYQESSPQHAERSTQHAALHAAFSRRRFAGGSHSNPCQSRSSC